MATHAYVRRYCAQALGPMLRSPDPDAMPILAGAARCRGTPALAAIRRMHCQSLCRYRPCLATRSRIAAPTTLRCRSRSVHVQGLALAPVVFGGLFVALWTWKCCMLVIFQNKIIYMPGLPPNARWERIEDYSDRCAGVKWREERVRASDGTDLALCVADIDVGKSASRGEDKPPGRPDTHVYILYFQGNAASMPPRLPDLSSTLCVLRRCMSGEPVSIRVSLVCLSYRGYWTSRGRPTEKGIRLDAAAALGWISRYHVGMAEASSSGAHVPSAEVVLWGQSIGSGVATNLAAECTMPSNLRLNSLVLETAFTSLKAMLEVLYPQKWLPYKHLWPFLRNQLDSWKNLGIMAGRYPFAPSRPHILFLEAAKDELVPAKISQELHDRAIELGFPNERKAVNGAFHNDTMFRAEGRKAVAEFLGRRIKAIHHP